MTWLCVWIRLEEIENQTNQEMERMCAADSSPEEVSIFSFPDSIDEDLLLWDHEEEETDPDRTLTTITLQTDTPTSSAARKVPEHHHHQYEELRNGNGHLRYYQNGSLSHSRNNSNGQGSLHLSNNSRPHIGYVNGTLSSSFHGYFRTTAVWRCTHNLVQVYPNCIWKTGSTWEPSRIQSIGNIYIFEKVKIILTNIKLYFVRSECSKCSVRKCLNINIYSLKWIIRFFYF